MIVNWNRKDFNPGIIHIHGTSDRVIPLKEKMNAVKISGGEHFMVMNNFKEISSIIKEELKNAGN